MLRRPQHTEDRLRLKARTARTFAAPLRAGVSYNSGPARSRRHPLRLKREHGAYRLFRSRSTARALRSGTGRARAICVVPSPATPQAATRHAVTGGRSSQLPEGSDRKRRAKIALGRPIRVQILDLMRTLRQAYGMALMLITHDLGVIAEMADYVVVMYLGQTARRDTSHEPERLSMSRARRLRGSTFQGHPLVLMVVCT